MSALEALAPSYALIARATSPVRTSDHLSDADSDASSDFDIDPDDFLDFLDSESEPEEEATAPPEPKSAPGRRGSTALAQASELASDEELRGLIEKKLSFHGLEPERMKSKKVRKAINTVVAASNRRQSLRRGSSAKTEAGRLDSKLGGFAASTVYRQLNHQLNQVIVAASKCDDHHFIRCIKPNHLFRPFEVTQPLVLQQLRASSVIEAVKLFASRKPAAQKMVLENASDAMARFIAMLIKAQGEVVVVESAAMRELRETEEEDAKVD